MVKDKPIIPMIMPTKHAHQPFRLQQRCHKSVIFPGILRSKRHILVDPRLLVRSYASILEGEHGVGGYMYEG